MLLRFRLLITFLFLALTLVSAQDFPYHFSPVREISYFGLGGALSLTAHRIDAKLSAPTRSEIAELSISAISDFDRGAIRNSSADYAALSNQLLRAGLVAAPLSLVAQRPARRRMLGIGLMLGQAMLLNDGITKTTKVAVKRARPLLYNDDYDLSYKTRVDAKLSFFSGHTSAAATLSFFSAKVFHDLHPDSKLRPYVWVAAGLLPAATGFARYRAGKHFPTDILVGYAVGAGIGILVPQLHKRPTRRMRMNPFFGGGGVGVSMVWGLE